MNDLTALTDDEIIQAWIDVLHKQGASAIPVEFFGAVVQVEWDRCFADPFGGFAYWLRWYGSVRVKSRRRSESGWQGVCINGEPRVDERTGRDWRWQLDLAEWLTSGDISLIEKARQLGVSFIADANFIIWFALAYADSPIAIISNKFANSKRMLLRAHRIYDRLPEWMRQRVPMTSRAVQLTTFGNGSVIEPMGSKSDSARSEAAALVIIEEPAFIENLEDMWASVQAAADNGGKVVAISTANGVGNLFYEWCRDGAAGEATDFIIGGCAKTYHGINGMEFAYLPYYLEPSRDDEWHESTMRKYRGSLAKFLQEYPGANWEEAFIASGQMFYDSVKVMQAKQKANEEWTSRDQRGSLVWEDKENKKVKFLRDPDGFVVVHATEAEWADALKSRRPFVIGADCAGDQPWGDFHAASAVQRGLVKAEGEVVVPHRQLVTIHGHMDSDKYAETLVRLGYLLGTPLIVPEVNGVGSAVIMYLRRSRYPRLYVRKPEATAKDQSRIVPQIGWYTTQTNKHLAHGEVERMLRSGELEIRDPDTLEEMEQIRFLGSGRIGAVEPYHDDRPCGLALATFNLPSARDMRYAWEPTIRDPQDEIRAFLRNAKSQRAMAHQLGREKPYARAG